MFLPKENCKPRTKQVANFLKQFLKCMFWSNDPAHESYQQCLSVCLLSHRYHNLSRNKTLKGNKAERNRLKISKRRMYGTHPMPRNTIFLHIICHCLLRIDNYWNENNNCNNSLINWNFWKFWYITMIFKYWINFTVCIHSFLS